MIFFNKRRATEMQKIFKMIVVFLFTLTAATTSFAANPSYSMTSSKHFTSQVNVFNQSAYSYTVNATYMDQYGASRKFVMALNAYPLAGSSILFPVVLPEYAVYLQIVRNIDGYVTYTGYVSSDDIYIRVGAADSKPTIDVAHH
jgi:hypothetical protein